MAYLDTADTVFDLDIVGIPGIRISDTQDMVVVPESLSRSLLPLVLALAAVA